MVKEWTEEEVLLLKQCKDEDMRDRVYSYNEIFDIFIQHGYTRSKKAIQRKWEKVIEDRKIAACVNPDIKKDKETVEETFSKIQTFSRKLKLNIPDPARKILALPCIHIPFHLEKHLDAVIQANNDADDLVILGDFLDMYAVSTWVKNKAVALRKEYDLALYYLNKWRKIFPKVHLVKGNHEHRLNRHLNRAIDTEIKWLFNAEILQKLACGDVYDDYGTVKEQLPFDNVEYKDPTGRDAWYKQIGKTLFCHPFRGYSLLGKTVLTAAQRFRERDFDFDTVVLAHTHRQFTGNWGSTVLYESGCMCLEMDYAVEGAIQYGPATIGYTVIYQDAKGKNIPNLSRNVLLGFSTDVDKHL